MLAQKKSGPAGRVLGGKQMMWCKRDGWEMMERLQPRAMMRETSKRVREWRAVMGLRMWAPREGSGVRERRNVREKYVRTVRVRKSGVEPRV